MPQPTRTCLGCGAKRPQAELVRLSAGVDGGLVVGGRGGRGAYVCPAAACAERVAAGGAIQRRLRARVSAPADLPDRVAAWLAGGRKPPD